MVEAITLEPEVEEIFRYVEEGKNFLLSGGAGSGKTYSLVHVIREAIRRNPTASIACITYTNAAVKEIAGRFNSRNLTVSTIHDFLWDNIKNFQNEIKASLVSLINDPEVTEIGHLDGVVSADYFNEKNIQYKEYTLIKEGIISHDELLVLSNFMFKKYPKLGDILKDKFQFLLVDEYQDTSPLVIHILLESLQVSEHKNIVGFFGDSMQSIYDDTIGNLNSYATSNRIAEIKKNQNRRNPRLVYELANKLRLDDIRQVASLDPRAPNMKNGVVKEGLIKFCYSTDIVRLNDVKTQFGWDSLPLKETKELNLTHNLIAPKAGFSELMAIYDGDKILDYKKRIVDYIKDNAIAQDFSTMTFGEVIDSLLVGKTTASEKKPILPTAGQKTFIDANAALFEIAKMYSFEIFRKVYVDKEALIDDKKQNEEDIEKPTSQRDSLIKHLFKIQTNINLYSNQRYNEFLRVTEFKIRSVSDKRKLKEIITRLNEMDGNTIEEVIEFAHTHGIAPKDDKLFKFIEKSKYLYDRVKLVSFREFQHLFDYLEGSTPFSTQHKIKGAEFDNVLVILDNGNWSKYNFMYLFESSGTESVRERTSKLFYVCCTRAKDKLLVYFHNPSALAISKAIEWFGAENVLNFRAS